MIKHIVSFKLKDDSKDRAEEIKKALETLPSKISQIKYFEVGVNISDSPAAYDVVLISEFDSVEDLNTYRLDPEHIKVTDIIRLYKSDSMVVDYNF
jgi:hypothetical protein